MRPWTFALIKPDAVANPIAIKWLLAALHHDGFVITRGCRMQLSLEKAKELYAVHQKAFFYQRLLRHVCSGPTVAMKLERFGWEDAESNYFPTEEEASASFVGDHCLEAIARWREVLGPSKLFANMHLNQLGEFDQIKHINFRQLFALSDTRNFGHGSDSPQILHREYGLFEADMKPVENPAIELFQLDEYFEEKTDILNLKLTLELCQNCLNYRQNCFGIANVKKVFLKAPYRVKRYHELCPGLPLPPEPITTRWGTWLDAVSFYATHFDDVKKRSFSVYKNILADNRQRFTPKNLEKYLICNCEKRE